MLEFSFPREDVIKRRLGGQEGKKKGVGGIYKNDHLRGGRGQ